MAGTLSLTDYDGTWAQWQITATIPSVVTAELGVAVHPEIVQTPFTVTVAAPRWLGVGDPAANFDPISGNYLVLDMAATP